MAKNLVPQKVDSVDVLDSSGFKRTATPRYYTNVKETFYKLTLATNTHLKTLEKFGYTPTTQKSFYGCLSRKLGDTLPTFEPLEGEDIDLYEAIVQDKADNRAARRVKNEARKQARKEIRKAAESEAADFVTTIMQEAAVEAPKAIVEAIPPATKTTKAPARHSFVSPRLAFVAIPNGSVEQLAKIAVAQDSNGLIATFKGQHHEVTYFDDSNIGMIRYNGDRIIGNIVDGRLTNARFL